MKKSVIKEWYGRTGNNIQQISNAIFFCKNQTPPVNFYLPAHSLLNNFSVCDKGGVEPSSSSKFFFYKGDPNDHADVAADVANFKGHHPDEVDGWRKRICESFILPHLKIPRGPALPASTLVIHLRGGDVFAPNPPAFYPQNPASFYQNLIKNFQSTIIVAEDLSNPVAQYFKDDQRVEFQSSSEEDDFATLLRAKNIASSGVGTFAMAAALCSENLENLFCTNLFQDAHLNPTMLEKDLDSKVNVEITPLSNYIKVGEWKNTHAQRTLMLKYQC